MGTDCKLRSSFVLSAASSLLATTREESVPMELSLAPEAIVPAAGETR